MRKNPGHCNFLSNPPGLVCNNSTPGLHIIKRDRSKIVKRGILFIFFSSPKNQNCKMTSFTRLFLVLVSVEQICAATAGSIFFNTEPWNVTLIDVDSKLGSFTTFPPSTINGNDEGTWQNYGAWDAIAYDVYYQSSAWSKAYCVRLSYLWDLVTPYCDAAFEACPNKKKRAKAHSSSSSNSSASLRKKTLFQLGCSFQVVGTCSSSGDPTFSLTTDCKSGAKE